MAVIFLVAENGKWNETTFSRTHIILFIRISKYRLTTTQQQRNIYRLDRKRRHVHEFHLQTAELDLVRTPGGLGRRPVPRLAADGRRRGHGRRLRPRGLHGGRRRLAGLARGDGLRRRTHGGRRRRGGGRGDLVDGAGGLGGGRRAHCGYQLSQADGQTIRGHSQRAEPALSPRPQEDAFDLCLLEDRGQLIVVEKEHHGVLQRSDNVSKRQGCVK